MKNGEKIGVSAYSNKRFESEEICSPSNIEKEAFIHDMEGLTEFRWNFLRFSENDIYDLFSIESNRVTLKAQILKNISSPEDIRCYMYINVQTLPKYSGIVKKLNKYDIKLDSEFEDKDLTVTNVEETVSP